MTKTRDLANLGGGFNQAGTGAVQHILQSNFSATAKINETVKFRCKIIKKSQI